jgi:hypothetical protein
LTSLQFLLRQNQVNSSISPLRSLLIHGLKHVGSLLRPAGVARASVARKHQQDNKMARSQLHACSARALGESLTALPQVIAASRRLICEISEEEKRRELKDIADVYACSSHCLPPSASLTPPQLRSKQLRRVHGGPEMQVLLVPRCVRVLRIMRAQCVRQACREALQPMQAGVVLQQVSCSLLQSARGVV